MKGEAETDHQVMKGLNRCASYFGFYSEHNEMLLEGFKEMGIRISLHFRKATCLDWTRECGLEVRYQM